MESNELECGSCGDCELTSYGRVEFAVPLDLAVASVALACQPNRLHAFEHFCQTTAAFTDCALNCHIKKQIPGPRKVTFCV